ncbi:zinc finger-containing ubiquitin peptidase 1 [Notolabrus celidotus]|uniref:zinc finger-containing ubiquitin peptidase 1 n=1 Tax=Notolabrus celidotus TaxID=1203425 RepID=UPI00149028EF|nr:zinc finger-containing ubiquitin peptidase 1 [Notolabrus celidotus]
MKHMQTCEICGEDFLLEEDLRTHLMLSHEENTMSCPFCSLSGVSYDELCFHISSAHAEEQSPKPSRSAHLYQQTRDQDPDKSRSASACCEGTNTSDMKVLTSRSCRRSCGRTAPAAHTDSGEAGGVCSSYGETDSNSSSSQRLKTRAEPAEPSSCSKAKLKRLSSPSRDPQQLACPMCALVCSNSFILQEHVELHLIQQRSPEGSPAVTSSSSSVGSSSGDRRFECPLCSVLCSDSVSLQVHVELHFDPGAAADSAGSSDLELARRLQEEEAQRRRLEEAWQEREEFKKLQRQFGVDSSGGYGRQMERTMERAVARGLMGPAEFHSKRAELMESLSSGVDDGRTRTQGVIRALYEFYQTDCRDCIHVWLSADTDHFCSSAGDKGWGCGYRNLQMILSSLHGVDTYAAVLPERSVPSIPRLQRMIEEAWKEGLDAQGASHFNNRLQGTRAWIGATEIYSLLTSLRISAHIVDFHRPTGPADTHPSLLEWVKQYFSQTSSNRLPPRLVQTSLPPLYLQHQGHSRSIVGLEQKKNGSLSLLLLDPASSMSETRKLLSRDSVGSALRHVRKSSGSLKHRQYQVVALQGVLSAEEKQISICKSRTLCAERIP